MISVNSRMQFEPSAKAEVESEPRAKSGLAVSRETKVKSEPKVKSESKGDLERPPLEVGRVAMEPGVKRERKEAVQRPQLWGMRLRGVANVNSQGEATLAAATEGVKQWYCRACGKISRAATSPNTSNASIRGPLWGRGVGRKAMGRGVGREAVGRCVMRVKE